MHSHDEIIRRARSSREAFEEVVKSLPQSPDITSTVLVIEEEPEGYWAPGADIKLRCIVRGRDGKVYWGWYD